MNLSEGVIAMLSEDVERFMKLKPVLQVADVRLLKAQTPTSVSERYCLVLSDGIHLQEGMLVVQHNDLVVAQKLQKGSVVQLTQFVCRIIQNRRIIIIIDLDVILQSCVTIGEPRVYTPKRNDSSVGLSSYAVHPTNQPHAVYQPPAPVYMNGGPVANR